MNLLQQSKSRLQITDLLPSFFTINIKCYAFRANNLIVNHQICF